MLAYVNFIAADQARVSMTQVSVIVQEEDGSTMFCADLELAPGYTLETVIIAPFDVSPSSTGAVIVIVFLKALGLINYFCIDTQREMISPSIAKTFAASALMLTINLSFQQWVNFVLR